MTRVPIVARAHAACTTCTTRVRARLGAVTRRTDAVEGDSGGGAPRRGIARDGLRRGIRSALVGALLALVWACGERPASSTAAPAAGPATAPTTSSPRRIVALTVGAVDMLALLGQLDRVVAVEEDCHYPGTESLVRIRNDDHTGPAAALNVEAVLALRPDLVLAKEDLRAALSDRGFEVMWFPSANGVPTIDGLVTELGRRLDVQDRARDVLARMHARADGIRALVAGRAPVRVYYEAGKPGRTVGAGTVVDDMIRLAGGTNVAGDVRLANPNLSSEAIVAADPDVIVLSPWGDPPDVVARRPGWDRVAAVRSGRVHQVDERDRRIQYPSPSCVDGCAELLVPWLHPDLAPGARK